MAILFILLASSCGGTKAPAPTAHSVRDVRATFTKHGIELARLGAIGPIAEGRDRSTSLNGSVGDLSVSVTVYPTVDVGKASFLLLGNDPRHVAKARNVVAAWAGSDSAAIRAAMNDLR